MANSKYFYGAIPDTPDVEDFKKKYGPTEIPTRHHPYVDLSQYVPTVYNQGRLWSSSANAVCSAYGMNLRTLSDSDFIPCRLFLYYNAREHEESTRYNVGTSLRETIRALKHDGMCDEKSWPYSEKMFSEKPTQCYKEATKSKEYVTNYVYESLYQDIDQLKACLKDFSPFVFAFNVYKSFHNQINHGSGQMPEPSAEEKAAVPEGMHAVVAVGYDDRKERFKVLNSWGQGWGDKGYFYMPYRFIADPNMCFNFWKISFDYDETAACPKHPTVKPQVKPLPADPTVEPQPADPTVEPGNQGHGVDPGQQGHGIPGKQAHSRQVTSDGSTGGDAVSFIHSPSLPELSGAKSSAEDKDIENSGDSNRLIEKQHSIP